MININKLKKIKSEFPVLVGIKFFLNIAKKLIAEIGVKVNHLMI